MRTGIVCFAKPTLPIQYTQ